MVSPVRILLFESNADADGVLVLLVFGSNFMFPLQCVLVVPAAGPPPLVILLDDVSCLEKECFLGALLAEPDT